MTAIAFSGNEIGGGDRSLQDIYERGAFPTIYRQISGFRGDVATSNQANTGKGFFLGKAVTNLS